MAAFDLFGIDRAFLMSDSTANPAQDGSLADRPGTPATAPTVAAFSPNQQTAARTAKPQSVLIHQKSPLLIATPPQVTRALAYSHPFILPLNHLFGLLAWSTDDPWESFLLLTSFWFLVLYGDVVTRWAGPVVLVAGLIFAIYSRRYSPLSSAAWIGAKQSRKRADSEQQRKTLDEILVTLQTFTEHCELLLDPALRLTEYLSTQSSATSATTRPALTRLFVRLLAFTPIWILLTLPPLRLITTQRVVLVLGTVIFSYHSQPARVTRAILWRSQTIRNTASLLTGLNFTPTSAASPVPDDAAAKAAKAKARSKGKVSTEPIRFTFAIYDNQRRWLGLGWTTSLFAYERQAWTDEHLNPVPDPEHYELPTTDNMTTKWRWAVGSEWHVEGANGDQEKSAKKIGGTARGDVGGWIYFDNKWQDGRKEDGWTRYTRSRKWVRDAELVEIDENGSEIDSSAKDPAETSSLDSASTSAAGKKKGWFGRSGGGVSSGSDRSTSTAPTSAPTETAKRPTPQRHHSHNPSPSTSSLPESSPLRDKMDKTSVKSFRSTHSDRSLRDDGGEDDVVTPLDRVRRFDWDRSYAEGVAEQLS